MYLPSCFKTDWVRVNPTPAAIAEKLDKYFLSLPPRMRSPVYAQAYRDVRRSFALPIPARPKHINDVISQYENSNRSPGLPYTKMGVRRKDEVDPNNIIKAARSIKWHGIKKWNVPCNAVAKTMVGPKPKLRLIWVYPTEMTYIEGMFAMPLIKAYKGLQSWTPYAIWVQYAKGHMKYISSQLQEGQTWLGCDWSSFDSNVPAWMIRDAFGILEANLDWSGVYDSWGVTKPRYLRNLWRAAVNYFIDTPVKYPDGSVRVKHHGVPSGSFFTNIVDTLVNAIAVKTLLLLQKVVTGYQLFMGDDSLVACSGPVDLNCMSKDANRLFGFVLNPSKSDFCVEPQFLGFTMGKGGVPKTEYCKLVAQLMLPARPDRSLDDVITRAKSLRLSSLGANRRFLNEINTWLKSVPDIPLELSSRSELAIKLAMMGIDIHTDINVLLGVVL